MFCRYKKDPVQSFRLFGEGKGSFDLPVWICAWVTVHVYALGGGNNDFKSHHWNCPLLILSQKSLIAACCLKSGECEQPCNTESVLLPPQLHVQMRC